MIRPINENDALSIHEICEKELGHHIHIDLRKRIQELSHHPSYYLRVYEDGGEVLGFIQAEVYDLLYGESGWNVMALAVKKDAQGKGIGKQLLVSLEDHARKDQRTFIRLNCRDERKEAHGFYEHLGYVHKKTQKYFIKKVF